jgi:hypothetical protein
MGIHVSSPDLGSGRLLSARRALSRRQVEPAVNPAKGIQASQAAEIDTMKDLLG